MYLTWNEGDTRPHQLERKTVEALCVSLSNEDGWSQMAFQAVKFKVCLSEGKKQSNKLAPSKEIRIQTVQGEPVKIIGTRHSLPLNDRQIQKKIEEILQQ